MRQKPFSSSFIAFLNKAISFLATIILITVSLESNPVLGSGTQVPGLSIARFALPSIAANQEPINPTGTLIGTKALELKKMLQSLEAGTAAKVQSTREIYEKAIAEVNEYYLATGEIEAMLQLGTTPANPKLIALRNNALLQLDQIADTIATMDGLTTEFSKNDQQVKALASHIDATLRMPGAVDEDHAHLILMSEELARVDGAIARILSIINTNSERQSEWLENERVRFDNLSSAIDRGQMLPHEERSGSKLSYPRPILPELEAEPKKTSQVTRSKKNMEKKSQRRASSSKANVEPLPLTPTPEESREIVQKPPKPTQTEARPVPPKITTPTPETKPPAEPLPMVAVEPHPKVHPLPEEENVPQSPQASQSETSGAPSYSAVAKGRSPLVILNAHQDPRTQKWYLFSSAKRGLKGSSDVLEIVNVVGDPRTHHQGENVKNLLIEMGLKPNQLRVINVKGDEEQKGQIYIFGR